MQEDKLNIIKVTLSTDPTVSPDQQKAILDFCANPEMPTDNDRPRYLSIKSAAELLDVSKRTVQRWIKDGRIDSRKINGFRRIPMAAIEDLCNKVDEGCIDSTPDPEDCYIEKAS